MDGKPVKNILENKVRQTCSLVCFVGHGHGNIYTYYLGHVWTDPVSQCGLSRHAIVMARQPEDTSSPAQSSHQSKLVIVDAPPQMAEILGVVSHMPLIGMADNIIIYGCHG